MTRTRAVPQTVLTLLAAGAIGVATAGAAAAAVEGPSATTVSASRVPTAAASSPAVATVVSEDPGAVESSAAVAPPTMGAGFVSATAHRAAFPGDPIPARSTPAAASDISLLDLVPNPLNCLLSTGFALFCLGVPLS